MGSSELALVAFACVFGGALLGLYLRVVLPEHHLSDESLDIVRLATGLVATMAALVLGLLISSAMGSFDRINNELVENAARIVTIDHLLRDYGPETREMRELLKRDYTAKIAILTSGDPAQLAKLDTPESMNALEIFQMKLLTLAPRDDVQRGLRARVLQIAYELDSTRALVFLQKDGSIPMPMLAMLASWLVIIFAAFGLCAPRNYTTIGALFVCSLCAAGAIFLILEMDQPLDGWISIRGAPLHAALAHLGQ
jgi:hypothetical protein